MIGYPELESILRDHHFYPEREKTVKKNSEKTTALHITAFSFAKAELIEKKLKEILTGVDYTAIFMPNNNFISIQLK